MHDELSDIGQTSSQIHHDDVRSHGNVSIPYYLNNVSKRCVKESRYCARMSIVLSRSLFFSLALLLILGSFVDGFQATRSTLSQHRFVEQQWQFRLSSREQDDDTWFDASEPVDVTRRDLIYNTIGVGLLGASGVASFSLFQTNVYTPPGFSRIPTQFIAALGDPKASGGTSASDWGVWRLDPGPRGVWLRDFQNVLAANSEHKAPAGWLFDPNDWWLEEHGLIMEQPSFPLPTGRYLVTGGRLVTTGLTIQEDGSWKLDEGTLFDVTHLPCRSARYTPLENAAIVGSPLTANPKDFPVAPGAIMPLVPGCNKKDYAVLFLVGKEQKGKIA